MAGVEAARRAREEYMVSEAASPQQEKGATGSQAVMEPGEDTPAPRPKIERAPIIRTVFKDDPNKPRTWKDWPFGEMPFPADRRRQKTLQMREAILRSAARAFSRRGYHGTSMDDIAKELLMTKGALYYYFRDKEDILYACHDYSLSLVLENLAQVEASDAGTEEKLRELIKAHVNVMLDALQGSAMALDFNALSPHLLDIIIAKRDKFEKGMRRLIAQGMQEGVFTPGDEKLSAFMILGAINWVTKWYREGGRYDGQVIGDAYADTFIHGLKGTGKAAGKPVPKGKSVAKAPAKSAAKAAAKPAAKGKAKAKAKR